MVPAAPFHPAGSNTIHANPRAGSSISIDARRSGDSVTRCGVPPLTRAIAAPVNVTKQQGYDLSAAHRRALIEGYRSDVARLSTFFPEFDVSLWTDFR